jgi:simple sugar transport system substrate-binding protein
MKRGLLGRGSRWLAACAFGGLLAAATAPAAADDAVRVTMIIYSAPGDPFWNPVIHGAQEAAKDRGVSLDIQYGDQDPVKQNNLIQTAIANKVDGIAVVNWTPDAFTAAIAAARKAGIGVVVFDTDDPRPNAT